MARPSCDAGRRVETSVTGGGGWEGAGRGDGRVSTGPLFVRDAFFPNSDTPAMMVRATPVDGDGGGTHGSRTLGSMPGRPARAHARGTRMAARAARAGAARRPLRGWRCAAGRGTQGPPACLTCCFPRVRARARQRCRTQVTGSAAEQGRPIFGVTRGPAVSLYVNDEGAVVSGPLVVSDMFGFQSSDYPVLSVRGSGVASARISWRDGRMRVRLLLHRLS